MFSLSARLKILTLLLPPPTPRLSQTLKFARREDAFRRREETLRKQDLELQESLIKFNKFLQENER